MPTLLCAAALESVVAFLATVYMVKKKSMHSFLTAILGTGLNILLNFALIPQAGFWGGALGAALATMAGYAAVLVARMIDAPRLIRFNLCLPRLCVSIALLLVEATLMTVDVQGRIGWTAAVMMAVIAINLPALLTGLRSLLKFRKNT
jgi:O-antigen/teichoic acid export membrane protein